MEKTTPQNRFFETINLNATKRRENSNHRKVKEMKKGLFLAIIFCLLSIETASAQTIFKTPKDAATALYSAWSTKTRTKARLVADNKAVAKLFSTNFIARRKFAGCTDQSETEKGLFTCVYEDPTDNLLNVAFEAVKKGKTWRIRWVTFAAEN